MKRGAWETWGALGGMVRRGGRAVNAGKLAGQVGKLKKVSLG